MYLFINKLMCKMHIQLKHYRPSTVFSIIFINLIILIIIQFEMSLFANIDNSVFLFSKIMFFIMLSCFTVFYCVS